MKHPNSPCRSDRRTASTLAALAVTLGFAGHASAADVYWFGGGGDNHFWSDSGNWFNGAVPVNGDVVHLRGALSGATNINDRSGLRLSQLLFQNLVTSGQSWGVQATTTADLVQNQTQYGQTLSNFTNFYDATIDNATTRDDAGAIYVKQLNVADNLPSRSQFSTVTLNPGANGIVVTKLGGAGNVVIDGPGYVSLDGAYLTLDGTIAVKSGTLSLGESFSKIDGKTKITLAAGTTAVFDDIFEGNSISALNGAATLRDTAGLSISTNMAGSFIKTGAGALQLRGVADGSSFDLREGSLALDNSLNGQATNLASLNVSAGTRFDAAANVDNVISYVSGSGTIDLGSQIKGRPSLTLTPSTVNRLDVKLTGPGRLVVNGTGAVEFRTTSSFGGGTTIQNGTAIVTAAFGGLGGGDVGVNGGTLAGSGRVSGVVSVKSGGTVAPSRADTPGLNTGTFTVGGLDLTAGGNVAIEFNGITQGTQVDLLAVNNGGAFGNANITNGTLSLARGTNFFPASGKFPKVSVLKTGSSGSLTGVFARVNGVRVNDSYSFAVTYDAQNVYAQLADVSDTNLDNVQDYRDVYALAPNYKNGTTSVTWLGGDLSGDGTSDYTDLLLVNSYVPKLTQSQFDALQPKNYALWYDYGRLNGLSVPEPASLAAVTLGGLLLGRRRRA